MLKVTFITQVGFQCPFWKKAFPKSTVIYSPFLAGIHPEVRQIVCILSTVDNWQSLVTKYSKEGHYLIVMTTQQNMTELKEALSSGAQGYVDALSSTSILKQATKHIEQGAMWLPSVLVVRLTRIISNQLLASDVQNGGFRLLTKRERGVSREVCNGLDNKEIAEKLNISIGTVKTHLTSIFQKLKVKDRVQLVLKLR
jgi:DNA-binding NarL/FixJ family response regulator